MEHIPVLRDHNHIHVIQMCLSFSVLWTKWFAQKHLLLLVPIYFVF